MLDYPICGGKKNPNNKSRHFRYFALHSYSIREIDFSLSSLLKLSEKTADMLLPFPSVPCSSPDSCHAKPHPFGQFAKPCYILVIILPLWLSSLFILQAFLRPGFLSPNTSQTLCTPYCRFVGICK